MKRTVTDTSLAERIKERTGQNINLCYFCRKCTNGCPVVEYMDLTPSQLMRSLQLGRDDTVLESKTPWLCAHCETCFARCPMSLDVPQIMDAIINEVRERGIKPAVPEVDALNQLALAWIKRLGRMYELAIMGERNLRSGQLFRDMEMGRRMLMAGKLKLLPQIVLSSKRKPEPLPKSGAARVAYFPGCSQHSSGIEYGSSTEKVAMALGLELAEPKGWTCCGSGMGHTLPKGESASMAMRNLALVEAAGDDTLTTGCAACFSRFKRSVYEVERDADVRKEVETTTGYDYTGKVKVAHLLDTFVDKVGLNAIADRVKRPLEGLKVVCYYGCLLTRPPEVNGADHPEYPMNMDLLVRKLGAKTLDWSYKTDCCGGNLMLTETGIALRMSDKVLAGAKEVGADAIVVACPFCQGNLDTRQDQIARELGHKYDIPIIYFTQLMGLAFGFSAKEMALDKHFVSVEKVMAALDGQAAKPVARADRSPALRAGSGK